MKTYLFLFTFCLSTFVTFSQNFTWVHGSNINTPVAGVYGTLGVPATTNTPGSRHGSGHWTDVNGNIWLYGGEGFDINGNYGWLCDLWRYNTNTDQWTWMAGSNTRNQTCTYGTMGVPSSTIHPGSREFAVSWVDNSGNFWLFGGDGYAATSTFGRLGDLWRYSPTTSQWTCVNGFTVVSQPGVYGTQGVPGVSNMPGGRNGCAVWTDAAGKLWLFGGMGTDVNSAGGELNDLWRYDIPSNEWTWVGGTNLVNQTGIYGTLATTTATNYPGGREFPAVWQSSVGIVYIFGGYGYDISGQGELSDMWKYDPSTNMWTWITGPNLVNQSGVYGTLGVGASSVIPGGRNSGAFWKDAAGDFWLFGGSGYSSTGPGSLNDMFRYDPCANQWSWMNGSNLADQSGTYGTLGSSGTANTPGGRIYNNYWKGPNNTLWLFGGIGFGSTSAAVESMNDLWRFDPPCYHNTVVASSTAICSSGTVTLAALPGVCEGQVLWYTSPTGTTSIGSGNTFSTTLTSSVSNVYTLYAQAVSCTVSPRGMVTITVNPTPSLNVSTSPQYLCNGSTALLTANGASSYTWNTSTSSNQLLITAALPAYTYTLEGIDNNGCYNSTVSSITVHAPPTISATSSMLNLCAGSMATLTASGANTYNWSNGMNGTAITVTPTQNTSYTVTGTDTLGCANSAVILQPVNPLPQLSTTAHAICEGNTGTLSVSGAVSYTWSNSHTGGTTTVNPIQTTNYTVTGTDANGCENTAVVTQTVSTCVGIKANGGLNASVSLFPNPNHGEFTLLIEGQTEGMQLLIFNALGQQVFEQPVQQGANPLSAGLSQGLYYYTLQNQSKTLTTGKLLID